MSAPRLRPAARGLVIDADDRLLLCRFDLPEQDVVVWTAPGGGVEPGEEIDLVVDGEAVHVWHQRVVAPGHVLGYDGAVNDYFLVRTEAFEPRGSLDDEMLAAENLTGFRWWTGAELAAHDGPEVFGPPRHDPSGSETRPWRAPGTPYAVSARKPDRRQR